MPAFQAPTGTRDVLPPESRRWSAFVSAFAQRAEAAGYGLVVSPLFEDIGVFTRGIGESTDVVRKEMYDFDDKGGRRIALRPDGTASVARAFAQHRPPTPFKAWYVGPNFRYERPQAGRFRQHHQVGIEAIGSDDPDLDVEVLALAWGVYASLGLSTVSLLLNTLGDAACRPAYRERLSAFLVERQASLCDEHRERIGDNPLRVLDCKRAACRDATADAPRAADFLCDACESHFARVQEGLRALAVPFTLEPRLVRGLDYYTRTTFEFACAALDSAQNALGGGGRYDGLIEALGGPPTPGVGFGMGIERILLACDAEAVFALPADALDVFVVDTTDGTAARDVTHELRSAGLRADRAFDARSMKSQFKAADRSGAAYAVIIGDEEHAAGTATVRPLRTGRDGGVQKTVRREDLVAELRDQLSR